MLFIVTTSSHIHIWHPKRMVKACINATIDNWDLVMVTIWDLKTGHRFNWYKLDTGTLHAKERETARSEKYLVRFQWAGQLLFGVCG